MSIVQVILVPIAAGVIVHKIFGAKVERVAAVLPIVSVGAVVVIVAAVVAATRSQILTAGMTAFLVVALQNAFGMALGFAAGKVFRMDLPKCKCLCFEVGMQNSALGVALASVHFAASPMTALPSAIGALWHNITGPVVATFFQKWRAADEKKSILDLMEESIAKAREEKTAAV